MQPIHATSGCEARIYARFMNESVRFMRRTVLILTFALGTICCVSCQSGGGAAPATYPAEPFGNLIDPRIGFDATTTSRGVIRRLETAWNDLRLGRTEVAEQRLRDLSTKNPEYLPATVALAALAIERSDLDEAERLLEEVQRDSEDYVAASAYQAELAGKRGEIEKAFRGWKGILASPDPPPLASERVEFFRTQLFDQLFSKARDESDAERSIVLLREALGYRDDGGARILLVQKLIASKRYDDARRQLEPLVGKPSAGIQLDIDEALAEIDAGKGRYQEAISRFDRLARENPERFSRRLSQIKQRWLEENLPPQYNRALNSGSLSRAELAVLLYWKVPAVRFAQAPQPPIAVDIAHVAGRDEFVRALALRFFQVDSITRSAGPDRLISAGTFLRILSRVIGLRGVPQCGRSASGDSEASRAENILNACGVSTGNLAATPEAVLSGRHVAEILEGLERVR